MFIIDDIVSGLFGLSAGQQKMSAEERMNERNIGFQREVMEWQKGAQQQTWDREDTAVQRRKADLEGAGLSPVLAAGQGAAASSPIKLEAPRQDTAPNIGDSMMMAMSAMKMQQDISKTSEERKYIEAQKRKVDLENKFAEMSNPARAGIIEVENLIKHATKDDLIELAKEERIYARSRSDISKLDVQLKNYGLMSAQVKALEDEIRERFLVFEKGDERYFTKKGLEAIEIEYLAKKLLVEQAEYNLNYDRKYNTRGGAMGSGTRDMVIRQGLLDNMMEKVFGVRPIDRLIGRSDRH